MENVVKSGLKIAVAGKGGVGKTTVSAVLAKLFSEDGLDVLAVDADPDANLCTAFGLSPDECPEPLINMKALIGERTGTGREAVGVYFKLNPRVSDLPEKHWHTVDGVKLLAMGGIEQAGSGCACAKGSFLKALLSHTMLQREEVVVVDLDAGVECMGRASILGIDALIVVVEPGSRSIETATNIASMAKELGVKLVAVIVNKVTSPAQLDVIREKLQLPILTSIEYSPLIQQADLERKSVFQSDPNVVKRLTDAKESLLTLMQAAQPQS
ncbi:MAG: AAA family ATPase [Planctomycetes bacterium]|nr:AAA family ATPase [Planctomycetota bacterium]